MRNPEHVDVEATVAAQEIDFSDEEKRGSRRADYTFLTGYNKTAFVVEAKKPKVSLRDEKVINQLKRYGYTLEIDIGILHDFEEFRAFDTAFPVTARPEVNLIKEFDIRYGQYPDFADKLLETFGREAVLGGSIQKLVGRVRRGKSTIPVDRKFLDMLKGWRERLAIGLAKHNPAYSIHDINEYVGRILNRLIFLRVIEERHALTGNPLEAAWNKYRKQTDVGARIKLYNELLPFFEEMNDIFNGVLFKPTDWDTMTVPDPPIFDMLKEIYNPHVPYDFGVFPIELLGTIYERFLGEVVVRKGEKVTIEQKPEVRKAGGVYYTPKYIVDYIVEQTVGKLIKGKSPDQIRHIKILDPACGSGSFLIGAYEKLMKYHLEWYKKHPKKIKRGLTKADAYKDGEGKWRLGFHVKQIILRNNIYGVDIDERAVEVTMLSLYLKLMENETYKTLEGSEYLPLMEDNIKCGNSLIGTDILDMDILPEDADERQKEIERIRPFDWEENFPLIFEAGGFDAVIGNPPYIDSETMVTYQKTERDYISRIFRTAQGNWDIYIPFWELSFKSVKKECRASLITPNKWISIGYGKALREYLFNYIEQTCDCSGIKVFLDAGNNPIIVTIVKNTGVQSIARLKYREEYNLRALSPIAKNELTGIEWGILLSEHGKIVLKVRGIPSKISDFFLVENPFTTSEAYKIKEILEDGCYNEKNHFKFTNTGTIDPYITLWGLKKTTYIKDRYNRPVVNKTKFRNLLSKRFKQTQQKKIIITGMRYFESFLDFKGEFIAGKSTIIVCDKPNHDELAMLLPILNSKLLSFYINESFSALGIDGGVNFSKKLVSNLPLPKIRTVIKGKLIKLGEEETALNKRLHKEKSPSRIKSIEGQIAHTDKVIDKLVYELYDLTEEEIGIVEGE